jgi:hypothetical protein
MYKSVNILVKKNTNDIGSSSRLKVFANIAAGVELVAPMSDADSVV